jgi:hypothetical protein
MTTMPLGSNTLKMAKVGSRVRHSPSYRPVRLQLASVATSKLEKTVTTGFETKQLETIATSFEAKPVKTIRPWF